MIFQQMKCSNQCVYQCGEKLFKNENDKNLTQKQIIRKKSNENLTTKFAKID